MTKETKNLQFAIVVARWNNFVTQKLLDGAKQCLIEKGVPEENITTTWVPGSFEIPTAARWATASNQFDAVICLGAVILGETDHYQHVSEQAAAGIQQVALDTQIPVIFGVLTCKTTEQALARSGGTSGNSGSEAANAALEMVQIKENLRSS
tara:strand:- start:25242 stop:25697 length:456 start_codon:yes stop_codon:yes gene_type:complete